MLQRFVVCSRRHLCTKNTSLVPKMNDLMSSFNADPKQTTLKVLQDSNVVPTPQQLQTMVLQLVSSRHKEEASSLVKYALDHSISLNYERMFHTSLKESKLNLNAFAHVMVTCPQAFPPSLHLHALRGCLGVKNYRAAISLYELIENEKFTPSELNKPLLSLLKKIANSPPHSSRGLRDVQYLVTDTIMFRNRAKTPLPTLLERVHKCNPAATPDLVRLLVYTAFAVPQEQWPSKLSEIEVILRYCLDNQIKLMDPWPFTTAFLKAKSIDHDALIFAEQYAEAFEANIIVPDMKTSWLAVQATENVYDERPLRCVRALMASEMTRQMYHYGFHLCFDAENHALAKELLMKLTCSKITPNENTLSLVVPLLVGAEEDEVRQVLSFFSWYNIEPSPEEYHLLFQS